MNFLKYLQNSIEQKVKTNNDNEGQINQSSVWMQSITWGLITTSSLGITWLAIAQTEEIVVAPGILQPIGAVKDIQMPIGGITDKIFVSDGDRVKKGQLLIKLDTESSIAKFNSEKENIELMNKQIQLKQNEMSKLLRQNKESMLTLTTKLVFENEILDRFTYLVSEGASAELQLLQQKTKVREAEGRLLDTKLDGERRVAISGQEIQRLKSELSTLKAKFNETQITLNYSDIRSPVDGIVFDLKPTGIGYVAQSTTGIMKIVPYDELEAKVEISSSDIGFVRDGMKVDISIDSFPATDFGVLEGKVKRLGSDALPPDVQKQKSEYRFPAWINLEKQELELTNGKKLPLQVGMSLTANIKLRKVTYLQMLLGGFQDKADSLRQI